MVVVVVVVVVTIECLLNNTNISVQLTVKLNKYF